MFSSKSYVLNYVLNYIMRLLSIFILAFVLFGFADKQNVSLISYDEIDSSMKTLGFTTEQYKLTIAQLQSIAELHGAQGILFGKVKSGARSITSSIDIDSSIELALVDVQSGVKVVGEAVEETMSLRERRSVLRSVSDEIISRYDKIFDKINR